MTVMMSLNMTLTHNKSSDNDICEGYIDNDTVKKVKFKTCYLIILQDNSPGNVNYDRFVKKTKISFFF